MKDLKELSSTHKALDTISRKAVDKIIDDLLKNDRLQASPSVWHGLHMIKQLPSAQPDWDEMLVICDCCGHAIHVKRL